MISKSSTVVKLNVEKRHAASFVINEPKNVMAMTLKLITIVIYNHMTVKHVFVL